MRVEKREKIHSICVNRAVRVQFAFVQAVTRQGRALASGGAGFNGVWITAYQKRRPFRK